MCEIFSHFTVATGVLEYDRTFSLLGYGLFALLIVSGGMIAYAAIRHALAQTDTRTTQILLPAPEYHKVA
jgi:putative copper export protein